MSSAEADAQRKRFATYQAAVALWGGSLCEIEGDFGPEFIVSRWGLTRRFQDLGALSVWLVDVGAWHKQSREIARGSH